MIFLKSVIIGCILSLLAGASVVLAASGQLCVGYGKQLLGNKGISQFEMFYRMPLLYQKDLGYVWGLSTALELGAAVIDDSESEASSTRRLSLMPQLLLSPNDAVYFFLGLGTEFMMGETDFDYYNLGGPFFLQI